MIPELRAALQSPNMRAFLRLIREGESGQAENAYRMMFGGGMFDDFAYHPRKKITRGSLASTAAGAYQFLSSTWDECRSGLSLPDFSPASQDLAAVFLIRRRGALADVLAGRVVTAIEKCAKEWASLPGSPYGQPVQTLVGALAVYARWGGVLSGQGTLNTSPAVPDQPASDDPAPVEPTPPPAPKGAPMIPIPGLLIGLASSLIQAFAPLAREKVEREIARHTDNPAVAEQVATAVIDAAKAATGQADPIAAVAAVKADPAAAAAVQESTLDHLARMGPVLDRLAAMDAAEWGAEESSRTAAAARAAAERNDPAMLLTYASIGIVILLIVFVGAVAAVQIIKAGKADTEVWAALTGLIGWATAKSGSIYDYRFGTSRSSSAKDVIIGELSSRNRTPAV